MKKYLPGNERLLRKPPVAITGFVIFLAMAFVTTLMIAARSLYEEYSTHGWHTMGSPPHFTISRIALLWLYALVFAYFLLARKRIPVDTLLAIIHIGVTIGFIYLCYFTHFLYSAHEGVSEQLYYISLALFIAAQIAFVYRYARWLRLAS